MTDDSKSSFFRQSGWMMIATFVTGVLMWGVHPLSKIIEPSEYEVMGTMLRFIVLMTIPVAAIQIIVARHASAAITEDEKAKLAAEARFILKAGTMIWLLGGIGVAAKLEWICVTWQVSNPAVVWVTYAGGLALFCWAVFIGILQGRQNFLWFGWAQIINGFGRVGIAWIVVVSLGMQATGIMSAAFVGFAASAASAGWQVRDIFREKSGKFDFLPWVKEFLPLALAGTTIQIFMSVDQMVVNSRFPEGKTGAYLAAVTLANALVIFTIPIALVMFPKVVRSNRLATKSDILPLTLLTTLGVGMFGALCLTFLAPIAIKLGFNEKFAAIAPLVPWFAWCILPLALSNVFIGHFIARGQFRVTSLLVIVAVAYLVTLIQTVAPVSIPADTLDEAGYLMPQFKQVVQTLGVFNLILLAAASLAYMITREREADAPKQPATQ
jgi:O-antigen/teichoic acid export membrane protein